MLAVLLYLKRVDSYCSHDCMSLSFNFNTWECVTSGTSYLAKDVSNNEDTCVFVLAFYIELVSAFLPVGSTD